MHRAVHKPGFTIVELLIVIVIIGILAAVVIVAYNGVTQKANQAAAQSAAEQANKSVLVYTQLNADQIPSSLAAAGVTNTGNATLLYHPNTAANPQTFCITSTVGNQSFYVNNFGQSSPTPGACAGDGINGAPPLTNLFTNPSAESTTSYSGIGGASIAVSASQARTGTNSLLVTLPASASPNTTGVVLSTTSLPTVFAANTTYMLSAYVYVPSGTGAVRLSEQSAVASRDAGTNNTSTVTNGWTRIYQYFTTSGSGTLNLYLTNSNTTPASATQFYIDDLMITQGQTLYTYADPLANPTAWAWTGSANNSTSTGPAL